MFIWPQSSSVWNALKQTNIKKIEKKKKRNKNILLWPQNRKCANDFWSRWGKRGWTAWRQLVVVNRCEGACVWGPEASSKEQMLRDRLDFPGCGADSALRMCHYTTIWHCKGDQWTNQHKSCFECRHWALYRCRASTLHFVHQGALKVSNHWKKKHTACFRIPCC